jgi:hypothetical protein
MVLLRFSRNICKARQNFTIIPGIHSENTSCFLQIKKLPYGDFFYFGWHNLCPAPTEFDHLARTCEPFLKKKNPI